MNSSRNIQEKLILQIYKSTRSVFRLSDIAMLSGIANFQSLNRRLNYYVQTGQLLNPRKGIYTKLQYRPEEMACSVFVPAYISLEYVLQNAGIIFQYDSRLTLVSYLSREVDIDNRTYRFRKIKEEIFYNTDGIIREDNINIAIPERAFLDQLYLDRNFYFDNLRILRKEKILELLPVYSTKTLEIRSLELLQNDRYK